MSVNRVVIVFLKLPRPGAVKTRLAAGLSGDDANQQAVEIYKELVVSVFETLALSEFDILRIHFDPPESELETRAWLTSICQQMPKQVEIEFLPQASGNLGDRLISAIHGAHGDFSPAKVAAFGTDCVEITPETISMLWEKLDTHDLTFGPTFDGGYYLVGTTCETPEIFSEIPWSTEETLQISLNRAKEAGRRVALLEKFNDVDTLEDWEIAKQKLGFRSNRV